MPVPHRLLPLLAFLTIACGGGGSGPSAIPGPALAISFPPSGSATDRATMTITGTAAPDGRGPITDVRVGGIAATTTDGYATWRVEVPVVPGANDLLVEASNDEGVTRRTHRVRRVETMVARPDGLYCDPASNRAWVVDRAGQLVEFDLATGARRRVDLSGTEFRRFDGRGFPRPEAQDVVIAGGSAYVTSANAILHVDLVTGVRSFFSLGAPGNQSNPPSGTLSAGAICIDRAGDRLLVCDRQLHGLVLVDLATGVQTTVVKGEAATGLWRGIAFDSGSGDVYSINETIYRIDPDDGTVAIVSEAGNGPDIARGTGAAVGPFGMLLYVADADARAIIEVDLDTGSRRILPGDGVSLVDPRDVELDALRNRLLVIDAGLDAIVAVDLTTGERTMVSPITIGDGPPLHDLADIQFDPGGRLLGLRAREVIAIDGPARTSVVPIGTSGAWHRLDCDGGGRIYAIGEDPIALIEIDETTRATRIVTTDFEAPEALVVDGGRPLVLDTVLSSGYQELWSIDPATGARDAITGNLPFLVSGRLERDDVDASIVALTGVRTATDPGYRVVRFDPDAGTSENLGTYPPNRVPNGPAVPPPPPIEYGEQAAVDSVGATLYLVSTDRVLRFDLRTGATEALPLSGVPVRSPAAAAYDDARGLVLVADSDWGGILAVDTRTGASVLLAR